MFGFNFENINWPKMSFPWSEQIKKRIIKYLLNRYVGNFLLEKLSLDQLTVDLYNGTGSIKELDLDASALNEVASSLNLPIRFVEGYIGEITVTVPWHNLLVDSGFVEVSGLLLTIEPTQRSEDVSMVDSMIESMNMTSSMQIVQECLNSSEDTESTVGDNAGASDSEKDSSQIIEGIEHFAHAIDSVLNRIKVRFLDTTVRLEHIPKNSHCGVGIEMRIRRIDYCDEAGKKTPAQESTKNIFEPLAFATKKFIIEGVSFYTDEFSASSKGMMKSMVVPLSSDSNSTPESGDSKISASGSGDSFKTADTSPAEEKQFEYNHEKTVKKLITNANIPMEPILFAKLNGTQDISLKLKQTDVIGPKIDLQVNCGSLLVFLSPRQIQLLIELCEGIASPVTSDKDLYHPDVFDHQGSKPKEKLMNLRDFQKVENELKELSHTGPKMSSHALNLQQGWSVTPLEDSDEDFVPMSSGIGDISKNMSSSDISACSDMESSISSSMSGSTVKSSGMAVTSPPIRYTGVGVVFGEHTMASGSNKKKNYSNVAKNVDDPTAVVTHFRLQISNVAAAILHEDILTVSMDNCNMVSKASVAEMQAKSEDFFSTFIFSSSPFSGDNVFQEARKQFTDSCQLSHLRLMAAPITVDGNEKILTSKWEMGVAISIGCVEILECLVDTSVSPAKIEYSDLLCFEKSDEPVSVSDMTYAGVIEPKLRVNITQSHTISSGSRPRRQSIPKLDIKVTLGDCASELDMSIVDRISALINRQEVCSKVKGEGIFSPEIHPKYLNSQTCFKQTLDDVTVHPETRINVKVASTSMTVKLRFPIPDLRPSSNMDRVPWWKRNLRKDILSVMLKDFEFVTTIDPHRMPYDSYEIRGGDIHILFQEREEDAPISLLRATSSKGTEKGFDMPRIVIVNHPSEPWMSLEETVPRENIMTKSMMGFLDEVKENEPNPFSSKQNLSFDKNSEFNEIATPSKKDEVLEFIETTLKNVQLHIDIHLPDVQLILPSKHIYEVIYNRLVTDLLLWEPSAPKPVVGVCNNKNFVTAQGGLDMASVFMSESIYESTTQFTPCNAFNPVRNSDSEEEIESQFHSVYEHKARFKQKQQKQEEEMAKNKKQTQVAFKLTLGHAVASVQTPYRDSKNNVLPGQHGEVMLIAEQGTIFAAVGYQGNVNLGYTCIWADKGYLYHKAANITPDMPLILNPNSPLGTSHLDAIFYPNDPGVITKLGSGNTKTVEESQDQIMLSLKMDFDEGENFKTIVLAGCVRGSTLRHYMSSGPTSWVTQLGDMFDVQDYPVAGYVLPQVVTEMNFHLWNCALDYRPLYLPIRSMLTIDAFSISSNLTISSNTNVLHFLVEEAALFLSEKLSAHTVDLKKHYVCVADVGRFELSLRITTDDINNKKPRIDLIASNNNINVRTCADSCKAFLEFIIYLAGDGDLIKEAEVAVSEITLNIPGADVSSSASSHSSECATMKPTEMQETLFNPRYRERDTQQLEMVRGMMDDAMIESTPSHSSEDDNDALDYMRKGVEVFFFPDDNIKSKLPSQKETKSDAKVYKQQDKSDKILTDTEYALEEAAKESLDSHLDEGSSGTDEEFVLLDNDPGTGIKSPSGKPQIRSLSDDPIIMRDNHFTVPIGKIDLLKSPKNFPLAALKYTLQELTLVWHMYGGSDFRCPSSSNISKKVVINDTNGNPASMYDNHPNTASDPYIPQEPSVCLRGGDVHFSSGHISQCNFKKSPPHSPQQSTLKSWWKAGGSGRNHNTLVELQLNKVRFQHELFPDDSHQVSRNVLLIQDVEIHDKLTSSRIKKLMHHYSSEQCPRQANANMIHIKSLTTRPDGPQGQQETSLKVSLQPLRLHVDQDTLFFICRFFQELLASDLESDVGREEKPPSAAQVQAPIMTINLNEAAHLSLSDDQQLLVNLDEKRSASNTRKTPTVNENTPIYFKSFTFSPDVPIHFDYIGKHVDLNSEYGTLVGIMVGLGQLNNSELTLKRLVNNSGVLGIDKLIQYATNEWVNDIYSNQVPSVLGGVGPLHSVFKLVGGIRDLVLLPIEQYQRDGRVVRGIQRGTSAFSTNSAHALLDLSGRFVSCIQSVAETVHDMVSSGPRVEHRYRLTSGQPQDIREGVTTAYNVFYDGIETTARAFVEAASQEHQHKGLSGAIGGILRQIPPTCVKPIIVTAEATQTVIGGVTNQLIPDAHREAVDKWKPYN